MFFFSNFLLNLHLKWKLNFSAYLLTKLQNISLKYQNVQDLKGSQKALHYKPIFC